MKAYVLVDHICEADIVVGVFLTRKTAQAYIKLRQAKDKLAFEGPEVMEFEMNQGDI